MRPDHDPLRPHAHDPNPAPPSSAADFVLGLPDSSHRPVTPADLAQLPVVTVADCFVVSTGHGTSGPFAFTGPRLIDFVAHFWQGAWDQVEVISGDGFGTRVHRVELEDPTVTRPIILAVKMDGAPLTRAQGLVRLIVPSETDDALRQVKWVGQVNVKG